MLILVVRAISVTAHLQAGPRSHALRVGSFLLIPVCILLFSIIGFSQYIINHINRVEKSQYDFITLSI